MLNIGHFIFMEQQIIGVAEFEPAVLGRLINIIFINSMKIGL